MPCVFLIAMSRPFCGRGHHILCQDLCVAVCKCSSLCSAIPSASKILATVDRDFDLCFSVLVLKDYPGESASQGDPSLLLEDSRGPEGKNTKTTVTFFFFLVRRLTD